MVSTVTSLPLSDKLCARSWNRLAADPLSGGKYEVTNSMFIVLIFGMRIVFGSLQSIWLAL